MKKSKKIITLVIGAVIFSGSFGFNNVQAKDATNAYVDKFMSMDFQKMMDDSSSSSLQTYMNAYNDKNNEYNSKYSTNESGINSKLDSAYANYEKAQNDLANSNGTNTSDMRQKFLDSSKALGVQLKNKNDLEIKNFNVDAKSHSSTFTGGAKSSSSKASGQFNSGASAVDKNLANNKKSNGGVIDQATFDKYSQVDLTSKDLTQLKSQAESFNLTGKFKESDNAITQQIDNRITKFNNTETQADKAKKEAMDLSVSSKDEVKTFSYKKKKEEEAKNSAMLGLPLSQKIRDACPAGSAFSKKDAANYQNCTSQKLNEEYHYSSTEERLTAVKERADKLGRNDTVKFVDKQIKDLKAGK